MNPYQMKPEDREYFIACVASIDIHPDNGIGWVGRIDHFNVADRLGKSRRWSMTRFQKFERWGWVESRNNFDAWLLVKGLEVYRELTGKQEVKA